MTLRASSTLARLFSAAPRPDSYFRTLADHLQEALFVVDMPSGLVTEVNHAALVLTGFSRGDLAGRNLTDLMHPHASPNVLREALSLSSPIVSRQLQNVALQTYSGKPVMADLRIAGFEVDSGHVGLLVFATSADARQESERRATLHSNWLHSMAALAELLAEPDLGSFDKALSIGASMLAAQSAALYRVAIDPPRLVLAAAFGPATFPADLSADELTAQTEPSVWTSALRPETALARAARTAGWGALLSCPLGEPPACFGLLAFAYRGGDTPPAEDAPLVAGLFARNAQLLIGQIGRAHGLVQSQAELRRTTSWLGALLEQSEDAVLVLDAGRRIAQVNPAAELILGYSVDELVGSQLEDVLVSSQDLGFAIQAALADGHASHSRDIQLHRRTGQAFPATVRIAPLASRTEAGSPMGFLLILRDISERKAIEIRSHQLEQRALLGEVSAIFAHEVRNPLNGITTGLQLLASRLDADHPMQAAIDKMMAQSTRLNQLMKDVLDFSKPVQLHIAPHDLGEILQRVLARWTAKMAHQHIDLQLQLSPDTPSALVDVRSMERVIINLVDNALQAMPEGGTLSVTLETAPAGQSGPAVQLHVADTGVGMPEDVKRRIFDPFYTTKASGTGLGLSITRHILNAHNGSLRVDSYPGVGSAFSITLPAAR